MDLGKLWAVFHPREMSEDLPYVTLVRAPSKGKPKREPLRFDVSREWVRKMFEPGGTLSEHEHRRAFTRLSRGTRIHLRNLQVVDIEGGDMFRHTRMKKTTNA